MRPFHRLCCVALFLSGSLLASVAPTHQLHVDIGEPGCGSDTPSFDESVLLQLAVPSLSSASDANGPHLLSFESSKSRTAIGRLLASSSGPFPEVGVENNWCQVLLQTGFYGYVLFVAANMIGDGAELLLLCPKWAPIVGSIVLPILGAIPDGMMVLFSGLGARQNAIGQLSVGMGAMAGSTVMLLTMPWFLSVHAGRVSIIDGKLTYNKPKLTPEGSMDIFSTGVGIGAAIRSNAKFMVASCSTYLLIFIPSLFFDTGSPNDPPAQKQAAYDKQAAQERMFAFVALFASVCLFFFYIGKMYYDGCESKIVKAEVAGLKQGKITIWACLEGEGLLGAGAGDNLTQLAERRQREAQRIAPILKPFFNIFDVDASGMISRCEFQTLLADLRIRTTFEEQDKIFKKADSKPPYGLIDFEEFVLCVIDLALNSVQEQKPSMAKSMSRSTSTSGLLKQKGADEEDSDVDEIPDDLADLAPDEQQRRIKIRAFSTMAIGTLLVLIFADPMVEMLGVIGDKLGIPKFYVSFAIAPFASNASELIASMKIASKKTKRSMVDSLSTLVGAAIMNNTFCMSIFLFLIVYQDLAYQYKAETIAIVTVQVLVASIVMLRPMHRLIDAVAVLALYPLCLLIVAFLENVCLID